MILVQIFVKMIVYPLLFGVAGTRMGATPARGVAAGFTRLVLGAVVGLPAGLFLFNGERGLVEHVLFFSVRFGLWWGVAALFFREAKVTQTLALAALGTLLNVGLDFLLFQEPIGKVFDIRFC